MAATPCREDKEKAGPDELSEPAVSAYFAAL
jgi:hypothetical protein